MTASTTATTAAPSPSSSAGSPRSAAGGGTVERMRRLHGGGGVGARGLTLVRGVGARVEDDRGRIYIDCVGGQGAASLGHAHPALTAAISRQARQLVSTPASFDSPIRSRLLGRLAELTGYSRFFLANSGAEAVEGAIKYARWATGRRPVIAARRGFHGRTMGALSATWERKYRAPFGPLVPGVDHVTFGDLEALEAALEASLEPVAAVLLEPIQGEGGVHVPPAGYLRGVRDLCTRYGALLVFDEVQTGCGRTGRFLAQDHWLEGDARADVVALAKGLGGGVPVGAVALRAGLEPFPVGSHGSTFGGNPLACAAAVAVIGIIEREDLVGRAEGLGAWALDFLSEALGGVPRVREVRGLGLMIAVELRERVAPWLRRLQEQEGILAPAAGKSTLRLLPPLVIAEDDWRDVVERIADMLAEERP
ncbi:MAG: aminotransferase class III-fold pyridoxal phosphate-dependent enzyme [Acidobacteriota bacterium]